jgi:hypothetical protein
VDALSSKGSIGGHFLAEQGVGVVHVQPDDVHELGHDQRFQQAFDLVVSGGRVTVPVQGFALDDGSAGSDIAGVLGNHQVAGAAAYIDTGDSQRRSAIAAGWL